MRVLTALLTTLTVLGNAPVRAQLRENLGDKTLVVWAAPADLTQRGGSALTIDDMESHFDGIIFGELAPAKWMAGSDFYRRSQKDQESRAAETAGPDRFVQVAIVYEGKDIAIYRDGAEYATHPIGATQSFGPGSVVLFGKRHVATGDSSCFRGRIDDARIYDKPLSAKQISSLKANQRSGPPPLAWWTFEERERTDRMGAFPEMYLTGGARISGGALVLEGEQPTMIAAPEGFLGSMLATRSSSSAQDALVSGQRQFREKLLSDPHRPKYHFVSPEGRCMPFDSNGAIYWRGKYHLCYIFQDHRGHCWGHVSSKDLLHWRWHSPALAPGPGDVDRGIFSGNCFVNKQGQATMLYHGVGAGNCIATSAEPDLEHWTKLSSNPIIPIPPQGSREEKLYSSWDPHGWLEGDTYYAIFGGSNPTVFKADTLAQWHYVGPFMSGDMPDVDDFEDVSCPDFFKLGDKHMLLCISHARGCRYYLGTWKDEQFHPETHARMNWPGGTCFAPETLVDDKGRRIMWAWVLDRRGTNDYGWSGTMTLPRVFSLGPDGTLRIRPPVEIEQLRMHPARHKGLRIADGAEIALEDVRGDCLELALTIDPGKATHFGLKVRCSPDGQEQTAIECDRSTHRLKIDVTRSSLDDIQYYTFCMKGGDNPQVTTQEAPLTLQPTEKLQLRIFLDRSIVEVFANDRQCITQRIYPSREDSLGIRLFSEGGSIEVESLQAWEMAPTNPW